MRPPVQSLISDPGNGESYADLARALASDYYKIYVVDPENEDFIEYSSPAGRDGLAIERKGIGFFDKAIDDTGKRISEEDRKRFRTWFAKENLTKEIDAQGMSVSTFRLIDSDSPMYVSMKAARMRDTNRIILGVSIIDSLA